MSKFTCPRRVEDGTDKADGPFHNSGPNLDKWQGGKTCSYCGSIQAAELFKAVEEGRELTATDKSYKIYVSVDKKISPTGKFYYQHFTEEERKQFLEILNAKTIKWAGDIPLYVAPFFARRAES